jgi:hypothetical protein
MFVLSKCEMKNGPVCTFIPPEASDFWRWKSDQKKTLGQTREDMRRQETPMRFRKYGRINSSAYFYTLQVTHAVHTQTEKEGKGVREDNNSRSRTRREEKEGHGKALAAAEAVTPTMVKAAVWH